MLKDFLKSVLGTGVVYLNTTESANTAIGSATVLASHSLKPRTLTPGRVIKIKAWGRSNNPGSAFLYFGPHIVGQVVPSIGMDAWVTEATVVYAGSSSQSCVGSAICSEWFRPTNNVSTSRAISAYENSDAPILISVQVSSDYVGAITLTGMLIEVFD